LLPEIRVEPKVLNPRNPLTLLKSPAKHAFLSGSSLKTEVFRDALWYLRNESGKYTEPRFAAIGSRTTLIADQRSGVKLISVAP
jgi:hypothetical protein